MKIINGGITAPIGFVAAGIHCGMKKNAKKKDLAVIYSEKACTAAAVYTTNKVKGEPLRVTMEHLENLQAQAIVVNSGSANTCTGLRGYEDAKRMAEITGNCLGIKAQDVIVASTGVIGVHLNMEALEKGIPEICNVLSKQGYIDAREAIKTTDTVKKDLSVEIDIDGKKVIIGGMAKGSGMVHPNMATMLAFITTDLDIDGALLVDAMKESVSKTYNMISVDGDTSTNDMAVILANGMAGNSKITEKNGNYKIFLNALQFLNTELAKKIAKDGEGATKLMETTVSGATSESQAVNVAKAIIASSLVKTAMFGADANWGRILCAIGYCGEDINTNKVSISFESGKGYIRVYENSEPVEFSEEKAKEILSENEIQIIVELNNGDFDATAWGCDLSYEYVRINGDYRS